ncbi:hypothetical protein GN956_G19112 [Arapaima gigas]
MGDSGKHSRRKQGKVDSEALGRAAAAAENGPRCDDCGGTCGQHEASRASLLSGTRRGDALFPRPRKARSLCETVLVVIAALALRRPRGSRCCSAINSTGTEGLFPQYRSRLSLCSVRC